MTHSSILAWRILWIEELGVLRSVGLQRVRHDKSDVARTHPKQERKPADLPGRNPAETKEGLPHSLGCALLLRADFMKAGTQLEPPAQSSDEW